MTTLSREENSITFSLAELARIEEERLHEEEARRVRSREAEARERQEAAARRRAEEEARINAAEQARAKREREEAEARAREQAREQAAIMTARIEAEAKARLEAENAARAHELALLRTNNESGKKRLQTILAAVLGVAVLGGALGGYAVNRQVSGLDQQVAMLREEQSAAAKERDQARTSELSALDRRLERMVQRPAIRDAKDALATAQEARKAIDAKALEHGKLHAFSEAIDALESRLDALDKLAALDGRLKDLEAWASQRRKEDAVATAKSAGQSARATLDDSSVVAYELALNKVRDGLASQSGGRGGAVGGKDAGGSEVIGGGKCAGPGDPLCSR